MQQAAIALAIIVLGAALSPVVMLGLIGLPVTVAGGVMLAVALSRVREEHGASSLTEGIGLLIEVLAGLGIAASAMNSTFLAWQPVLGWSSAQWASVNEVDAGALAMTATAWLLLPSLIALGIHLRTGWRRERLASWWLMMFSVQPAAVLVFMIFALLGAPLTA